MVLPGDYLALKGKNYFFTKGNLLMGGIGEEIFITQFEYALERFSMDLSTDPFNVKKNR